MRLNYCCAQAQGAIRIYLQRKLLLPFSVGEVNIYELLFLLQSINLDSVSGSRHEFLTY